MIFVLVPRKVFLLDKNNLMSVMHSLVLCLLFICTTDYQEAKSNTYNQIEVLLQRDFRLEVLTEYCILAKLWFLKHKELLN